MTNSEKLQKIIAAYTPLDYTKIDLKIKIKDKYIAVELKDNFCNDILLVWTSVNPTKLRNDMFVTLTTGVEILKVLEYILLV